MKIAFTTQGTYWHSMIDARFGRAAFLGLYDEETDFLEFIDNRMTTAENHGAGSKTAQLIFELDPDILITGNGPGANAIEILNKHKVKIFAGAENMTVKEAYQDYKKGNLKAFS